MKRPFTELDTASNSESEFVPLRNGFKRLKTVSDNDSNAGSGLWLLVNLQ